MKILPFFVSPIALFAFNRPSHLACTLDALAANELASDSPLTIFCDGPRTATEKSKTDAVRRVAQEEVSKGRFASVCIQASDTSKGLAPSLIAGITATLEENERVIVLEDDLITSPYFLRYMNDGLDVYADNTNVASIHGYMYPHTVEPLNDTFFLRGTDCWGWATWRRAWAAFNEDAVGLLTKIYEAQEELAFNRQGTYDYTGMLQATAEGRVSSWAVRWLASAWLADMYTLYPAVSLVQQIGLDASGTHCGVDENCHVPLVTRPITVAEIDVAEDARMAQELADWLQSLSNKPASFKTRLDTVLKKHPKLHNFLRWGKRTLKDCLPPIAMRCLKKMLCKNAPPPPQRANIWQGDYPDWQSAVAACDGGYDSDAIFQKVVTAARKVRDGEALWERDSVCFYHEEYNWPLLASLMHIAALQGGKLHVLDFGGALGSTYMQHRKFLDTLPDFSWNVVEQAHVVSCGQKEFSTNKLHFYSSMDDCFIDKNINCVLLSSVLQYLPDPYAFINDVLLKQPVALLIDRTPFLLDRARITIQNVPEEIYKASYVCRWVDKGIVQQKMEILYTCTAEFASHVDPEGFYGMHYILKSKK